MQQFGTFYPSSPSWTFSQLSPFLISNIFINSRSRLEMNWNLNFHLDKVFLSVKQRNQICQLLFHVPIEGTMRPMSNYEKLKTKPSFATWLLSDGFSSSGKSKHKTWDWKNSWLLMFHSKYLNNLFCRLKEWYARNNISCRLMHK